MSEDILIKSKAIPSNPRSKNYPAGTSVVRTGGGGTTTITGGGGTSVDILKVDDMRSLTDRNVFSSLRTLAEILSRIIKSGDTTTEASDENTLSALRINAAIDTLRDESLSKAHPDETAFLLKALGGLIVNNGLDVIGGISTDTLTSATATTQILNVLNKLIGADADFSGNVQVDKKITTLNLLVKALADIYDLNVSHVATIMGTIVKEYVSSESFVSGFGGSGMKIYKALSGDWNLEIDNLTVRKVFSVFELMVQKITHQGGMIIRSAAGAKLTKVTDGGSYWKCEHDSTDDFVKDDQIICQSFTGTAIKRYWRLVTSSGTGYFNLSKADCEEGSGAPEVGDEVAVLGNRTVSARQKAQIDCAVGDTAPYRDDYDNINSYSLVDKLITRTGNLSGITDAAFGVLSGSGLCAMNAYLKGVFILKSGKKIEEAIADVENNLGARITATETELSAVPGRITAAISESKTHTDNSASAVRQETSAKIEVINGQISSKVSQEVFNELGRVVSQQGTEILQNKSEILLRASKEEFDALGVRIKSAEASISAQDGQIALKASQKSVNALTGRMETAESSIIQNAQQISLKVSASEAGSIADGKVNALKGDLQSTGIDIANRKVTVTADTFRVQDNYGNAIAVFETDDNGKPVIKAENINTKKLVVKSGATIGGFKVNGFNLSNTDYRDCWINIDYKSGNVRRISSLGNNLPGIVGATAGYFSSDNDSTNNALVLRATGATDMEWFGGNSNFAITALGGCKWRLTPGDHWSMPGVLYAARIGLNAEEYSTWGNGCKVLRIYKASTGVYTFEHDIGHSQYTIMVTPDLGDRMCAATYAHQPTYFSVALFNWIGYKDGGFHIAIIGPKY